MATTDNSGTTVAVLGLGIMGSAMARNLAAAGFPVVGWNRSPEGLEGLEGTGVRPEADVQAAVADADVVITMLAHGEAVDEVMSGNAGAVAAMKRGALWLQMSTVGLEATDRLFELANYRSLEFVDAPVLGTKGPAEEGELVVLAAGADTTMSRAQPVFDAVGKKTLWLQPVGAASRMKLVFNDWVLTLMGGLAETLSLAQALGLEPADFLEVIRGGAVDMPYAHLKGDKIMREAFDAHFPLKWAHKDAGLILDAVEGVDIRMAITEAVRRQLERAIDLGHGEDDMSAVYYASWPEGRREIGRG